MTTILIVEDDPNLRLLYEEEFADEGYRVLSVPAGEDALEIVAREKIDAVVLDLRLRGIDGLETLRRILGRRGDVAIVLNSAYASFKADFASWSADRYVVKSSDLSELKGAVAEALLARAGEPALEPARSS
ncbi:MAG: response regulator [Candidatus Eisenbacteria bacterium]|nr:response regulator [Candidatus Eisenbacteria bacterium]